MKPAVHRLSKLYNGIPDLHLLCYKVERADGEEKFEKVKGTTVARDLS